MEVKGEAPTSFVEVKKIKRRRIAITCGLGWNRTGVVISKENWEKLKAGGLKDDKTNTN